MCDHDWIEFIATIVYASDVGGIGEREGRCCCKCDYTEILKMDNSGYQDIKEFEKENNVNALVGR